MIENENYIVSKLENEQETESIIIGRRHELIANLISGHKNRLPDFLKPDTFKSFNKETIHTFLKENLNHPSTFCEKFNMSKNLIRDLLINHEFVNFPKKEAQLLLETYFEPSELLTNETEVNLKSEFGKDENLLTIIDSGDEFEDIEENEDFEENEDTGYDNDENPEDEREIIVDEESESMVVEIKEVEANNIPKPEKQGERFETIDENDETVIIKESKEEINKNKKIRYEEKKKKKFDFKSRCYETSELRSSFINKKVNEATELIEGETREETLDNLRNLTNIIRTLMNTSLTNDSDMDMINRKAMLMRFMKSKNINFNPNYFNIKENERFLFPEDLIIEFTNKLISIERRKNKAFDNLGGLGVMLCLSIVEKIAVFANISELEGITESINLKELPNELVPVRESIDNFIPDTLSTNPIFGLGIFIARQYGRKKIGLKI